MGKSVSLFVLTLLSGLACMLFYVDMFDVVIEWIEILRLQLAFRLLVIYLVVYWLVIEVKNSYLEWKYREDN